jgi:hypothetical protein
MHVYCAAKWTKPGQQQFCPACKASRMSMMIDMMIMMMMMIVI